MLENLLSQNWEIYRPTLDDPNAPVWQILYDEQATNIVLDETDEITMILRLGHSDTVRIMAAPGEQAARGTQYFWLSRDCYDFFPPLTILNKRGSKTTYSCNINMNYINLGVEHKSRITFEAENNLDFRLGTGPLRHTKLVESGDLAAITRIGEQQYQMRLYLQSSREYADLMPYAVHLIGGRDKRYGFLPNETFYAIIHQRRN